MIEFSASLLTPLRQGDPALFRAAQPRGESRIVAMSVNEGDASPQRLKNEYALRDQLDATWAVVPEAFVRHNGRLVLVSTDPGGHPLREHCGTQWALERFLGVASGLTRAVQAMHARRVVHLNLTPDDVLFDDARGHTALCGFGYAASIGAPLHAVPNPTALAYMAPEMLGGLTQTVDIPADLYALGCSFYEMLAARPPFDESDALAWVHAHLARLPVPLERIRPDLPRAVVDLVMKLLDKHPGSRYPSASALLVDIEACKRLLNAGHTQSADVIRAMHRLGAHAPAQTAYGRDAPLAMLEASLTHAQAGEAGAVVLENARLYAELLEQSRQRVIAQEALRHALAIFERAARLTTMGELVASIVHEVTQPINAIGTSAGAALRWLNRAVPDLVESRQMLEQIISDSTRAKSVVHGLRAMAGKSAPTVARFDVHAAIREVLALARSQLHEISVEMDEGVTHGACEVWGDRVQIQQVALNLIMNALEAMSDVADRTRIMRIGTTVLPDAMIEIHVADNGKGLDAHSMIRIFEPFFTTKPGGMGMGLVICRSIIQAHGGRLDVTPAAEFGTVVRFSLPTRRTDAN
jgi:signal transduction histidine kinase